MAFFSTPRRRLQAAAKATLSCGPLVLFAVLLLVRPCGAQFQEVRWVGGNDVWHKAANWTPALIPGLPGGKHSVLIEEGNVLLTPFVTPPVTRFPTIFNLTIGPQAVLQIEQSASLTIDTSNAGSIDNKGQIGITDSAALRILAGSATAANRGRVTLDGEGRIMLDGQARILGAGTPVILVNEDNTISGAGKLSDGTLGITNRGVITADLKGQKLSIDPAPVAVGFTNEPTGVLKAENGGILELLGGTFINSDAQIIAEDRSFVELGQFADILGGELKGTGTGWFRTTGDATLDSVTLSGDLDVQQGHDLKLQGTITNNGRMFVRGAGGATRVVVDGPVRLEGSGRIILTEALNSAIVRSASVGSLVNAAGHRIEGAGRLNDAADMAVTNEGTISANNESLLAVFVAVAGFSNSGMLEAANAGTLFVRGPGTVEQGTSGVIQALDNSFVDLDGVTVRGGTLRSGATASAIRVIGGGATFSGSMTNEGLVNVLDGKSLTLAAQGSFKNTGTIQLMSAGNGTSLQITGGDVRLEGGGRIRLSDRSTNLITQTDATVRKLINVDNTIEGSGNIGQDRLALENQSGGMIRNKSSTSGLLIDPPPDAEVLNSGTMEATDGGALGLFGGKFRNAGSGKIRAAGANSVLRIDNSTLVNDSQVAAEGHDARATIQSVTVGNRGVLAATNGAVMQIRNSAIANSSAPGQQGVIAAGDASRVELTDGTIVSGGMLNTSAGGVIRVTDSANLAAPLTNAGRLEVAGGATAALVGPGTLSNAGTIFVAGTESSARLQISSDVEVVNAGTMEAFDGGSLRLSGGKFRNAGSGKIRAAGANSLVLIDNSTLVNESQIAAEGQGSRVTIQNVPMVNRGVLAATGGAMMQLRNSDIVNSSTPGQQGVIAAGDGSRVELSNGTIVSGGALTTSAAGVIRVTDSANLVAPLTNDGQVELADGSSAAILGTTSTTLDPQGALRLFNHGTIALEGDASATRLTFSGTVRLDGGGKITLKDTDSNLIEGLDPKFGPKLVLPFLLNFNNTITGAGEIGNLSLLLNEAGGSVIATGANRLVYFVSGEVAVSFLGQAVTPDTFNLGLLRAEGSGGLRLVDRRLSGAIEPRNRGRIEVVGGSKLVVDGDVLRNLGAMQIDGTVITKTLVNGFKEVRDPFTEPGHLTIDGEAASTLYKHQSGTTNIHGRLQAEQVRFEGEGRVLVSGAVRTDSMLISGDPPVVGLNVSMAQGGSLEVRGPLLHFRGAKTAIDGTASVRSAEFNGGSLVINGALTVTQGDQAVRIGNAAAVSGTGTINGKLVSEGAFKPGKSPGVFTINGDFEQLSGGRLEVEIGGLDAGTQHDRLVVNGAATLDGVVVLQGINDFAASAGNTFDVLTATTFADNGFSLGMSSGPLVQPAMIDLGGGKSALRLTATDGKRYALVNGSWDTAANWTGATLPAAGDVAFIPGDPMSNTTVTGPAADSTVSALVVGNGGQGATSKTTLDLAAGIVTTSRGTTIRRNGRLTGEGTIRGDVYNAGAVVPGASVGILRIDGDYLQDAAGTLEIEVDGFMPGTEHDQVIVTGIASLDGTLALSIDNALMPAVGQKFTILTTADGIGGGFANVTGNTPSPAITLWPAYVNNNVLLVATVTGEKTWGLDADGSASLGSNWLGGVAPGGVGDRATFGNIISANRTIAVDQSLTVGTLKLDDNNNYTLAGPFELTLQAADMELARIVVQNVHGDGAHSIAAPVVAASNLHITQHSSGTLTIAGPLDNSAGRTITKNGPGTLAFTGDQIWSNGARLEVNAGRVRFALAESNSVVLDNSVAAVIGSDAVLELAGSKSALSDGTNHVNVTNDGALAVASANYALGALDGAGSTTVSGGTALTATHVRQASLSIAAGGRANTRARGGTSVLGALSIAGSGDAPTATFDLNNNAAIIDYNAASPAATIRQQILAGRGRPGFGATWNGMGITSSAAAAANAAEPESRSIGYADNSALPLGPYTNFRGQPVDNTSVLMAFTRTGDANLDGVVGDDDVTIVGATYAPGVPQPHWALGDFDYNGFVDDDDVTLLGVFYDPSAPPLITPAPTGVTATNVAAVPEPATVTLFALASGALALVALRRRRTR